MLLARKPSAAGGLDPEIVLQTLPAYPDWPLDYSPPETSAPVADRAASGASESQPTSGESPPAGGGGVFSGAVDTALDFVEGALMTVGVSLPQRWLEVAQRPANAQYLRWLQTAEQANGIPGLLLVRLAYQESRFRPEIISGEKVSAAGAAGIMQIVPRWHPGVDPLDARAAINYAGKYLATLYRQFGTWELALQAYNWGPGNLRKYLAGQKAVIPRETANYSSMILADAGAASGSVIA